MYTKQEIILKSHREGKSIRSIAKELGIHRKTVTRYINEFEAQLTLVRTDNRGKPKAKRSESEDLLRIARSAIAFLE